MRTVRGIRAAFGRRSRGVREAFARRSEAFGLASAFIRDRERPNAIARVKMHSPPGIFSISVLSLVWKGFSRIINPKP